MRFWAMAVAAILLGWAQPARAQESVILQFNGGQVTLRAQNAPVRTILAEWARLGGATIVNGDRVVGPPVTLELTDVPERQALDIVLRSAAGYMLAERRVGSTGASAFDRILILPTSVAPKNPAPPPAAVRSAPRLPGPRQPIIVRPPEADVEDPLEDNQAEDNVGDPDSPAPNRLARPPGVPSGIRPPLTMRPPLPPSVEPQIGEVADEDETDESPPQRGVAPTPTNPFGIPFGSSPTPGVVTPAPTPQRDAPNRVQ